MVRKLTHFLASAAILGGMLSPLAANAQTLTPQQAAALLPPSMVTWPDTVLVNGSVVTMDDDGINTNPGTVAEAMAISKGFIMAVGKNDDIRRMIGPNTKVMDLKGHMVLPGFIESHAHPNPTPPKGVTTWKPGLYAGMLVEGKTPDEVMAQLKEFVNTKIRPHIKKNPTGVPTPFTDELVNIQLIGNPQAGAANSSVMQGWMRVPSSVKERFYTPDQLNQIASDFPLSIWVGRGGYGVNQVFRVSEDGKRTDLSPAEEKPTHRNGPPVYMWNQYGLDLLNKAVPGLSENLDVFYATQSDDAGKRAIYGLGTITGLERAFLDRYSIPKQEYWKQGMLNTMKDGTAWGVTTMFGWRAGWEEVKAQFDIAREGLSPIRYGFQFEHHMRTVMSPERGTSLYGDVGPVWDTGGPAPAGTQSLVWLLGMGSELWDTSGAGMCLGKDLTADPKIKVREYCQDPIKGVDMSVMTFQYGLPRGWRISGAHTYGSHGFRTLAQLIYRAMETSELTKDDVRRMRMSGAHSTMIGALPELLKVAKDLNFQIPMRFTSVPEEGPYYIVEYGPEAEQFLAPARSWLDAGIRINGEAHFNPIWPEIEFAVTRKDRKTGNVFNAREAVDRVEAMKMFTSWNAYWGFAEKYAGMLQPGKWADYIVIDRDYFKIPASEIGDVKIMMTVMGDKETYRNPEFPLQFETASAKK